MSSTKFQDPSKPLAAAEDMLMEVANGLVASTVGSSELLTAAEDILIEVASGLKAATVGSRTGLTVATGTGSFV